MIIDHKAVIDRMFEFLYHERDELNAGHAASGAEMVHRHAEVKIVLAELRRLIDVHTTRTADDTRTT